MRAIASGVASPETVSAHVSRVLAGLGLRDRTQAVVAAYESGLVQPRSTSSGSTTGRPAA
jgi:hypothetical protein